MPSDFEVASSIERVGEGRFRVEIPEGWQQGRGAFGGLVLGTLLRAMERSEEDRARVTRTLTGDLCGPVLPGAAEIRVRILRRGANQTNVGAELEQGGQLLATATAVLSAPRKVVAPAFAGEAPVGGPWEGVETFPIGPPIGPVFGQRYEYRPVGQVPFGAAGEPVCEGWIRERNPPARLDGPALIGRLDAWWPTLYSLEPVPRPAATVSFAAQLFDRGAEIPGGEPLRYRARMAMLGEGFFVELRELWRAGEIVALNQQTFAILR